MWPPYAILLCNLSNTLSNRSNIEIFLAYYLQIRKWICNLELGNESKCQSLSLQMFSDYFQGINCKTFGPQSFRCPNPKLPFCTPDREEIFCSPRFRSSHIQKYRVNGIYDYMKVWTQDPCRFSPCKLDTQIFELPQLSISKILFQIWELADFHLPFAKGVSELLDLFDMALLHSIQEGYLLVFPFILH